jgi:hypothetical protein
MTALGGRDVERNISACRGDWTGLPGRKTHEAGRQDLGDLSKVMFGSGGASWGSGHCRKLNQNSQLSREHDETKQSKAHGRN